MQESLRSNLLSLKHLKFTFLDLKRIRNICTMAVSVVISWLSNTTTMLHILDSASVRAWIIQPLALPLVSYMWRLLMAMRITCYHRVNGHLCQSLKFILCLNFVPVHTALEIPSLWKLLSSFSLLVRYTLPNNYLQKPYGAGVIIQLVVSFLLIANVPVSCLRGMV